MGQPVFVPLDRARARALRGGETITDVLGHAASPSLLRAHGYDDATLEDAEYAALSYAGVQAVLSSSADPLRLVLAADPAASDVTLDPADPYGAATVLRLRWADVTALFADEAGSEAAIAAARQSAAGHALGEALDLPDVESLLDEHDLLWFAPEELDALP